MSMKIDDNGVVRDMTAEEIAEIEACAPSVEESAPSYDELLNIYNILKANGVTL